MFLFQFRLFPFVRSKSLLQYKYHFNTPSCARLLDCFFLQTQLREASKTLSTEREL